MKDRRKKNRRSKALAMVLALLTAAAVLMGGCRGKDIPSVETTVPATEAEFSYDGTLQTLADGDSFYTPGTGHSVIDPDRTVLYYNDLLLVFTVSDLPREEMDAIARSVDGQVMGVISGGIHAFQILVPEATLAELEMLAAGLLADPQVLYACCEYPVQIMGGKDDNNPWDLDGLEEDLGNETAPGGIDWWAEAIGAYTAWEYAELCQQVRVGIVDNGFLAGHEDLEGQITFITNDENNTAADHGTMAAGIIAAKNNDVGIRGIADTASLYCADLWPTDDPDAYHTMAEYLAVINYMAQCGVRVVNNSWGCHLPSEGNYLEVKYGGSAEGWQGEYGQWLEARRDRDLIPTAEYCIIMISQLITSNYGDMLHIQAAGNGLDNAGPGVDARYNGFFSRVTEEVYNSMDPSVLEKLSAAGVAYEDIDQRILVVGAVEDTRDGAGNYTMTYFSNYGDTVDICAPGYIVFTTVVPVEGFGYSAGFGTSFAAPMVTGAAAFLWSLDPELTAPQVRRLLLDSAQVSAVGTGSSEGWSYPMLNIGAAARTLLGE